MMSENIAHANWYAVSGSSDLPSGSARAVMLNGEDIVIWRSQNGVVRAWKNRCLHRGMRLSFGQVRGEQLTCRYHGWMFDHAGQCTYMPAQPSLKPVSSLCMESYSCAERNGLIWVNLQNGNVNNLDNTLSRNAKENTWLFCKSLFVNIEALTLKDRLSAIALQCFAEPHETYALQEIDDTIIFGTSTNLDQVCLALHPLNSTRTAIHLCITKSAGAQTDKSKLLHYQRWSQRLRWFLKNPVAEYDGVHPFNINLSKSAEVQP